MGEMLGASEVQRAVYLDFEGKGPPAGERVAPAPTLAGWLEEGAYRFVVFDRRLQEAAERKDGNFLDLATFLRALVDRCRQERRRIVYWSGKELDVFREVGLEFGGLAFDLMPVVKGRMPDLFRERRQAVQESRTASRTRRPGLRRQAHGLCVRCAEAVGFRVGTHYGWGKVGEFIRRCETQAHRPYEQWAPSSKGRWSRLLYHNESDCRAMLHLAEHVIRVDS